MDRMISLSPRRMVKWHSREGFGDGYSHWPLSLIKKEPTLGVIILDL